MPNLAPPAKFQGFDSSGNPLSGGKLYTYAAGTTTPQATYTDSGGGTPNPTPVILDARGEANIWLGTTALYKFVLKDSNDVTIWTVDNVGGASNVSDLANTSNIALGDALIGFKQSNFSGALSGTMGRSVHQKLQELISSKDFGSTGDDTTDDTTPINSILTAITGGRSPVGGQECVIPAGYYKTTAEISTPNLNSSTIRGQGDVRIRFAGSVDATKAVWRMNNIDVSRLTMQNISFNAMNKAGYCFVNGGPIGGKFTKLENCTFDDATLDGVLLGDPAGLTDTDTTKFIFDHCQWYNCDRYQVQINGASAFATSFNECMFGFSTGTSPINHLYIALAGGVNIKGGVFGALTNADANTCVLRTGANSAAGISMRDCYSEESRLLRTSSFARLQSDVLVENVYVNDNRDAIADKYAIYAPAGRLLVRNCYLGGTNANATKRGRRIYIGEAAIIENVDINAYGRVIMAHPERVVIEGHRIGAFPNLLKNWHFADWLDATAGAAIAYNFTKIPPAGGCVYTIDQAASASIPAAGPFYGPFAARIRVTTGGAGGRAGLRFTIQKKDAQAITVVCRGVMNSGSQAFTIAINGGTGQIGGTNLIDAGGNSDAGDTWIAWAEADLSGQTDGTCTIDVGLTDNVAINNNCWLDTICVLPFRLPAGMATAFYFSAPDNVVPKEYVGASYPIAASGSQWSVGDRIWNSTPAVGRPMGWICTVAGSPGTWSAMPNL